MRARTKSQTVLKRRLHINYSDDDTKKYIATLVRQSLKMTEDISNVETKIEEDPPFKYAYMATLVFDDDEPISSEPPRPPRKIHPWNWLEYERGCNIAGGRRIARLESFDLGAEDIQLGLTELFTERFTHPASLHRARPYSDRTQADLQSELDLAIHRKDNRESRMGLVNLEGVKELFQEV